MSRYWLAAAVLCLIGTVACGQPTGNGRIIGVRPLPSANAATITSIDPAVIYTTIENQLQEANSLQPIQDENSLALGLLPLDSTITIKQSERLGALQQLGHIIIQGRLSAIANVQRQVWSTALMSGSQKYVITSLLTAATNRLNGMQVRIANDLLPDQVRQDVTAVAAFRVYGLLLPQAHLLIAAYQLQQLATQYAGEQAAVQLRINQHAAGVQAAEAQQIVNNLYGLIPTMGNDGRIAVSLLWSVSLAGYPGNKRVLDQARNYIYAGRSVSDQIASALSTAHIDLGG